MEVVLWSLTFIAAAAAVAALRRSFRIGGELKQLKRDLYYAENRLKRVPEDIREAVAPLRAHVAGLAAGKPVGPDLVLSGRLYRDVSAEETLRAVEEHGGSDSGRIVLLDVRTPKEYAIKHAPGARLVPFEELEQRYRQDIPETAEKIFVYCMSGERSRLACEFLSTKGYTNLYNVQDGIEAWRGPTEGEGAIQFIQFQAKR
jgi:rhodanese-related sulfurtransferase